MKILVGSGNPVKISSVETAFRKYFDDVEVEGIAVESGVSAQPLNDETFIGAQNRAISLKLINDQKNFNASYFVGIEGGITKQFDKWFAFGCMCIVDCKERVGFGMSPYFELPDIVVDKLLIGQELGDVMDEIIKQKNSKQKNGAIGFFTNGVMNRQELYVEGLKVALIPFLHKEMFFNKNNSSLLND